MQLVTIETLELLLFGTIVNMNAFVHFSKLVKVI